MSEQKKPLGYLGGDIMSFGSNLAREYEYEQFKKAGIPGEVYSPVMNKSINDKEYISDIDKLIGTDTNFFYKKTIYMVKKND